MPIKVVLTVPDNASLAVLIGAVDKFAILLEATPYEEVSNVPPRRKSPGVPRYTNGTRNKGMRGDDLILDILKDGPRTIKQIETAFKENGFAANSASPCLSRAKAMGKITRFTNGSWSMK